MAQRGTAWHGVAQCGTARHSVAQRGMARHSVAWCSTAAGGSRTPLLCPLFTPTCTQKPAAPQGRLHVPVHDLQNAAILAHSLPQFPLCGAVWAAGKQRGHRKTPWPPQVAGPTVGLYPIPWRVGPRGAAKHRPGGGQAVPGGHGGEGSGEKPGAMGAGRAVGRWEQGV